MCLVDFAIFVELDKGGYRDEEEEGVGEDDSPEGLGCIWGLALEAGGAMEKEGGPDGLEGCEGGYFQGPWTWRLTVREEEKGGKS